MNLRTVFRLSLLDWLGMLYLQDESQLFIDQKVCASSHKMSILAFWTNVDEKAHYVGLPYGCACAPCLMFVLIPLGALLTCTLPPAEKEN